MAGLYPTPNLPYAMSGLAAVSGEFEGGAPDMYPHPFLRSPILGGGGVEGFGAQASQAISDYLPGDESGAEPGIGLRLPPAVPMFQVPGVNMLPMPSVPLFRPNQYGNRMDIPHLERWLQQMLRTRNWGRSPGAGAPQPHTLDSDLHTDVAPIVESEHDLLKWDNTTKQWVDLSPGDYVANPDDTGVVRYYLGHQTDASLGSVFGYNRPCVKMAGILGGTLGVDIFPCTESLYFGMTTDKLIQIDATWTGGGTRQLDLSLGLNVSSAAQDYVIRYNDVGAADECVWTKGFFYEIQKDGTAVPGGTRELIHTVNFTDGAGATVAVGVASGVATVDISAAGGADEHFDFLLDDDDDSNGPVKSLKITGSQGVTTDTTAYAAEAAVLTVGLPVGSNTDPADVLSWDGSAWAVETTVQCA